MVSLNLRVGQSKGWVEQCARAMGAPVAPSPVAWSYGAMSGNKGYDYRTRTNGEVHIFHGDRLATMLRGKDAEEFLKQVKDGGDAQQAMADAVGATDKSRPRTGAAATAAHMHGNGEAHAPQQFRRKSG